jgi:iron complex transport system permease protein
MSGGRTESYAFKKGYYGLLFSLCFLGLFFVMAFSVTIGTANISFLDSMKILLSRVPLIQYFVGVEGIESTHVTIVMGLRIPRILLAALVGSGLSVSGAVYQGLFKNPMADPYVLGVSSGAALGATLAIVLGVEYFFWGIGGISLFAFLFAIGTIVFVYQIAQKDGRLSTVTLLLTGVAVSFLMSSFISLMMIFNKNHVERIVFWLMGSVSAASWEQIRIVAPVVLFGVLATMIFARDLNIILTGDDTSRGLGIEVERVKKILLTLCSIMIAVCVCFSGMIGFVGLVVPHVFRMVFGQDHRILLPFSCLGGAIFMVVADALARGMMPPIEIPVGVITSLVGAPYFISLIYREKKVI